MKFRIEYEFDSFTRTINASFFVEADNEREAYLRFRERIPDYDIRLLKVEHWPDFRFESNEKLTKVSKHSTTSLDKNDPDFEDFFIFEGIVFKDNIVSDINVRGETPMLVWDGRFDW